MLMKDFREHSNTFMGLRKVAAFAPGLRCEHQVGSTNADLTQGFAGFVPLARTVGRH